MLPLPDNVLGAFSNTGKNSELLHAKPNQDRGLVVYPFVGDLECALCVVMDSHGDKGELIAEFAIRRVSEALASEITEHLEQGMEESLKKSISRVDQLLMARDDLPHRVAGTTLTIVVIRPMEVWIANVGDSHCVVGSKHRSVWKVDNHSIDHTPNNTEEFVRVKAAGAHIDAMRIFAESSKSGMGIGNGLALSRSLGNSWARSVGVISMPDIKHVHLTKQDQILIVASDGIWEFTNSLKAIKIASKYSNATTACRNLIKHATNRWTDEQSTYRDDITAIVIQLPALFSLMQELNGSTVDSRDEVVNKPMI